MVHSWKALLSGFHYHFWPILGLILQDANREEAVVSTLKGSKLHTTKVSDGWLCLFSGTLDFVIKLESESYKMQYYNNKILHRCPIKFYVARGDPRGFSPGGTPGKIIFLTPPFPGENFPIPRGKLNKKLPEKVRFFYVISIFFTFFTFLANYDFKYV